MTSFPWFKFYPRDYLTHSDVDSRLGGISKWTAHAWLSQGKLQRTKVGSRTMISESELAKVIREGGRSPVHENMRPRLPKVR